ncbi:MAG: WYL domain-containing protein, partial [Dysgonamonadaceae bacterium]|nr:WYL domain-containing protein [Dysgonamonadaceae bacterium]
IMEGFNLDTTVFTEDELTAIFTGLKAFDSVSHTPNADRLASKFGGKVVALADNMMIDLSSFYKDTLAQKIEIIKKAIHDRRSISFHYYYNKGEADKLIEPYLIVFKWSDWYVFGFCRERQDFRMYKLRRLWELCVTEELYTPREIPEEKKQFGNNITDDYYITAIYEPSEKYKLVEEYGPDSFTVMEDGRLWTKWGFTDPEKTIGWFLGFADKVQVIDPPEMVEKMKMAIENIKRKYEEKWNDNN